MLSSSQVSRVGEQHQAGSDSLLTSRTFFRMRDAYFSQGFDEDSFKYDSSTPISLNVVSD